MKRLIRNNHFQHIHEDLSNHDDQFKSVKAEDDHFDGNDDEKDHFKFIIEIIKTKEDRFNEK
jgi:hypothetical protein